MLKKQKVLVCSCIMQGLPKDSMAYYYAEKINANMHIHTETGDVGRQVMQFMSEHSEHLSMQDKSYHQGVKHNIFLSPRTTRKHE